MKRKEIESVEVMWRNPEPVIWTELSQKKEKQTPYFNTHIWNLKNGTDEPIYRVGMEAQMYRMNLWTHGGKEGMKWESSTDIYTFPRVKAT